MQLIVHSFPQLFNRTRLMKDTKINQEKNILPALVIGLGGYAYGKEKRAATMFGLMQTISPYFLISRWEDGSVSQLLESNFFTGFTHVNYGYLGWRRPTWSLITLVNIPKLYWQTITAFFREKCRLIVCLCISSLLNFFFPIVILRLFFKIPVVFYLGDIPHPNKLNKSLGWLAQRLSSTFIVNSGAVMQGLVQIGVSSDSIHVIYNGKDVNSFYDAKPYPFKSKFKMEETDILVGFIGQFSKNKGLMDFVKAAEIIVQSRPSCRFVLLGKSKDDYINEVNEVIQAENLTPYIFFEEWTKDIETVYAALDIVVVPSRHEEAASNVCIEAMASGVPIVATNVGGMPELVADGQTGFLVDKERPDQLAEKILQLVDNPQLRQSMGKSGLERARRKFDVILNADRLEKLISSTLEYAKSENLT
jgi:glycosyltransferase involved in cell wall biosynthesis